MTITPRTLVTQALRTLEILSEGVDPTSEQASDALALLNELVDAWTAETSFMAVAERNTYTLLGQAVQTIGATGDLVGNLPGEVTAVAVLSGTDEEPVDLLDLGEYEAIPDKATTATRPWKVRYERTFPNGTLKFWPVPAAGGTLVLYTLVPFASAALTLDTSMALQAGYAKALRLTLAEECASYFGVALPPTLPMRAMEARAVIQRGNTRPRRINTAVAGLPSGGGSWDYRTGRYL